MACCSASGRIKPKSSQVTWRKYHKYMQKIKDMVWSRDKWDAYFPSYWSPKLFPCYTFLCLTLRFPIPWFFPPYSLAKLIYCLCQRSVKYFGGKGCQQTCLEKLECVWLLLSDFCNCKGTMQWGNSLACIDVCLSPVKVKGQPWHHLEKPSHTWFSFPFAIFGNENWKCCHRFGI